MVQFDFTVSPVDPNRLVMSGANYLLASADRGSSWTPGAIAAAAHLAASPSAANVFYATTLAGANTFQISSDGGLSWIDSSTGIGPADLGPIAPSPVDPALLWLGALGLGPEVYQSQDGGASWSPTGAGIPPFVFGPPRVVADPFDASVAYVATMDGLFRTTDGGASWNPTALTAVDVIDLAVDPVSGALFATTFPPGLKSSSDQGDTWNDVGAGALVQPLEVEVDVSSGALYVWDVVPGGIQASFDGGQSWAPVGNAPTVFGLPTQALRADPSVPGRLYLLTGGYDGLGDLYTIDWNLQGAIAVPVFLPGGLLLMSSLLLLVGLSGRRTRRTIASG
jgi:photosystem II stability/assembly factor-like uncharacterized protein